MRASLRLLSTLSLILVLGVAVPANQQSPPQPPEPQPPVAQPPGTQPPAGQPPAGQQPPDNPQQPHAMPV